MAASDRSIRIDTREVKRSLAALKVAGPRAISEALNKTAFEILAAETIEVKSTFAFSGPNTERFLSKAFLFKGATPENLSVTVYAKTGSRNILTRQTFGATVELGQEDVGPGLTGDVAVPSSNIKRTAGGRVPAALKPARVTRRGKRGNSRAFVSQDGKVVMERLKGGGVRFLYSLAQKIRIKPVLDFFGAAERTARREFPKKANRVLEKLNLRR